MNIQLHHGDCLEILRTMPDASVDAIVTDPPYGLSFMGKKWDYDVPSVDIWSQCLRVLKPGGHLLAFAGTRTQHRMAVRIEDAGFEIRDMIAWVYGSGFPKSHNLKDDWQGWGTALKPALEPITVARKPLVGTVAENVLAHGTGAINVDGCRVDAGERPLIKNNGNADPRGEGYGTKFGSSCAGTTTQGRWPANLIHDGSEDVVGLFPNVKTGSIKPHVNQGSSFQASKAITGSHQGSSGSAARFFYCAKASKRDRDEGCEGLEAKNNMRVNAPRSSEDEKHATRLGNTHPTVKPTELMRYLCRLVTPPSGVILDPFMGSGSTGKAALLERFNFIGIEKDKSYFEIAGKRINNHKAQIELNLCQSL